MDTDHSPHKIFESLRRSNLTRHESQWLGGVATGLADKFKVDTVLVRGIAVALALLGGIGLIAYGLAWAFLPDEKGQIHFEEALKKNWTTGMSGATLTFILGVGPSPWIFSALAPYIWPALIIAAVLFIVFSRTNTKFATGPKAKKKPASPGTTDPTSRYSPPSEDFIVDAAAFEKETPEDPDTRHFTSNTVGWGTTSEDTGEPQSNVKEPAMEDNAQFGYVASSYGGKAAKIPQAPPIPGWVASIVVGFTALIVAATFCADYFGLISFPAGPWTLATTLALLFVGLSLVFAALMRRTSGGLLGLAIPLLVFCLIFGNTGLNSRSGFGVQSGAEIQQNSDGEYNAFFSNATVDLSHYSNLNSPKKIEINSAFATVNLRLPNDTPVTIEADGAFMNQSGPQGMIRGGNADQARLTVEINGAFTKINTSYPNPASSVTSTDF